MKHSAKRWVVGWSVFLAVWAVAGFVRSSSSTAGPDRDRAGLREAMDLLKQGAFLEAIGSFDDLAVNGERPETRARALVHVGDIYAYFLDNRARALDAYKKAVDRYGSLRETANAYFNMGMILYEEHRPADAARYFEQYLRRFPLGGRAMTARFMLEKARIAEEKPAPAPPPSPKMPTPPPATPVPPATAAVRPEGPPIRVLIADNVRTLDVSSDGPLRLVDESDPRHTLRRIPRSRTRLVVRGDFVAVNDASFRARRIRVVSLRRGAPIQCRGRKFRGSLQVFKGTKNGVDAVNVLPLEYYLYGVVPREMPPSWPLEALKAQAVAARTYALFMIRKRKDGPFDVMATTMSQVYGGVLSEHPRATQAVDATRGEVLTYEGKPILAYFHSNSGGRTTDPGSVWSADVPYLTGVEDTYSTLAPHCSWEKRLDLAWLEKRLRRRGYRVGRIRAVSIIKRDSSGRAERIRISHSLGETVLSGNRFRIQVGAGRLKSTLFTLIPAPASLLFKGKGFGHGVGMSQWGAYEMARQGRDYRSILKHYYANVRLARAQ